MVTRAEHLVEIHPSIEKSPGNIAHQRTQKSIGRQLMRARLAFGRPLDGHEIGIAAECEGAEMERPVTGYAVRLGCDYVLYGIHGFSVCSSRYVGLLVADLGPFLDRVFTENGLQQQHA